MIWKSHPHERTASEAGLSEHLLSLASSVIGYLQSRLELAGIEGKEAIAAYGKVAGFLAVAIALLLFGYIFLWIGVIALAAHFSHVFWGWISLVIGILHLVGTAGFVWAAIAKWGQPVFPETLKEFRKDQEWLSSPRQTENRN